MRINIVRMHLARAQKKCACYRCNFWIALKIRKVLSLFCASIQATGKKSGPNGPSREEIIHDKSSG